jgi:hypothetical protein
MRRLAFLLLVLLALGRSLGPAQEVEMDLELYVATRDGDLEVLRRYLKQVPRAWEQDGAYLGDTPVGLAIEHGQLGALKLFVEHGYDLHPEDWYDHPLRMLSPYTGRDTPEHLAMMRWILEQGVDDAVFALGDWVENDHVEGTRILLEFGVDPDAVVTNGLYSALDKAESEEMRELLRAHGATSQLQRLTWGGGLALLLLIGGFVWITRWLVARRRPRLLQLASLCIVLVAVLMLFSGGSVARGLARHMGMGPAVALSVVVFKLLPVLAILRALTLFRTATRLTVPTADEVLALDPRPPIVYLRSFQDDGSAAPRRWYHYLMLWFSPWSALMARPVFEEGLANRLKAHGPVLAIGDPREKMPELGAARLYVGHDAWQAKVEELLAGAQLVVLRIGLTEGVLWELRRSIERLDPSQLIVWIVPLPKARAEALADFLHEQSEAVLPHPIPREVCGHQFVYFRSGWEAAGADELDDIPYFQERAGP